MENIWGSFECDFCGEEIESGKECVFDNHFEGRSLYWFCSNDHMWKFVMMKSKAIDDWPFP